MMDYFLLIQALILKVPFVASGFDVVRFLCAIDALSRKQDAQSSI